MTGTTSKLDTTAQPLAFDILILAGFLAQSYRALPLQP
jgi:hypothetical protein